MHLDARHAIYVPFLVAHFVSEKVFVASPKLFGFKFVVKFSARDEKVKGRELICQFFPWFVTPNLALAKASGTFWHPQTFNCRQGHSPNDTKRQPEQWGCHQHLGVFYVFVLRTFISSHPTFSQTPAKALQTSPNLLPIPFPVRRSLSVRNLPIRLFCGDILGPGLVHWTAAAVAQTLVPAIAPRCRISLNEAGVIHKLGKPNTKSIGAAMHRTTKWWKTLSVKQRKFNTVLLEYVGLIRITSYNIFPAKLQTFWQSLLATSHNPSQPSLFCKVFRWLQFAAFDAQLVSRVNRVAPLIDWLSGRGSTWLFSGKMVGAWLGHLSR